MHGSKTPSPTSEITCAYFEIDCPYFDSQWREEHPEYPLSSTANV